MSRAGLSWRLNDAERRGVPKVTNFFVVNTLYCLTFSPLLKFRRCRLFSEPEERSRGM